LALNLWAMAAPEDGWGRRRIWISDGARGAS
jgi:hypothetical protein